MASTGVWGCCRGSRAAERRESRRRRVAHQGQGTGGDGQPRAGGGGSEEPSQALSVPGRRHGARTSSQCRRTRSLARGWRRGLVTRMETEMETESGDGIWGTSRGEGDDEAKGDDGRGRSGNADGAAVEKACSRSARPRVAGPRWTVEPRRARRHCALHSSALSRYLLSPLGQAARAGRRKPRSLRANSPRSRRLRPWRDAFPEATVPGPGGRSRPSDSEPRGDNSSGMWRASRAAHALYITVAPPKYACRGDEAPARRGGANGNKRPATPCGISHQGLDQAIFIELSPRKQAPRRHPSCQLRIPRYLTCPPYR